MAKDIYVVFNGTTDIVGETRDKDFAPKKAIEVTGFQHVIRQPKSSSSSTSGGHTAERTEHGEMILTKDIDKASTKLWQAASAGTVYNSVEIWFHRAFGGQNTTSSGTKRVNYLKIELKNVVISSININVVDGSELPTETFGIRYSAVKWTYISHKMDGTVDGSMPGMYSLEKNEVNFS